MAINNAIARNPTPENIQRIKEVLAWGAGKSVDEDLVDEALNKDAPKETLTPYSKKAAAITPTMTRVAAVSTAFCRGAAPEQIIQTVKAGREAGHNSLTISKALSDPHKW